MHEQFTSAEHSCRRGSSWNGTSPEVNGKTKRGKKNCPPVSVHIRRGALKILRAVAATSCAAYIQSMNRVNSTRSVLKHLYAFAVEAPRREKKRIEHQGPEPERSNARGSWKKKIRNWILRRLWSYCRSSSLALPCVSKPCEAHSKNSPYLKIYFTRLHRTPVLGRGLAQRERAGQEPSSNSIPDFNNGWFSVIFSKLNFVHAQGRKSRKKKIHLKIHYMPDVHADVEYTSAWPSFLQEPGK